MFTGIVKGIAEVQSYHEDTFILTLSCPLFSQKKLAVGASVAIDGVCLTANHIDEKNPQLIGFDLGQETRRISLLTKKKATDLVNVEFALCAGDPLDGHLVQGHVDGIVELLSVDSANDGLIMECSMPAKLAPLLVTKGSIAINGVSLTINKIGPHSFFVCLIPHTLKNTTFKKSRPGDLMHIETDIIGRYLQNLFTSQFKDLAS